MTRPHFLLACVPLVGFTLLTGCSSHDAKATVPRQDAAEAQRLLVGKWEGDWSGAPRGFEFKESGEASYLTRKLNGEERRDGKPVTYKGTYRVPVDNELAVSYAYESGRSGMGFWFTVSEDEISFFKVEGQAGSMRRVKAFSAALTGEQ